MVDLTKVINEHTFVISDLHLGHFRVLAFESIRVEYLADYNSDVIEECQELLDLLATVPIDEQRDHQRITELCKYLIDFHDDMIIEKWNDTIDDTDTVLCLGDLAFRDIEKYTSKLNGNKILLRGNHDLKSSRHYIDCGWKSVIESVMINLDGRLFEMIPKVDMYWNGFFTEILGKRILFSHYPIQNSNQWDVKKYGHITDMLEDVYNSFNGDTCIHGHTHTKLSDGIMCMNVSIEHCTSLSPMTIKEVLEKYENN